jgi:hypothetical protein
VVKRREVEAKTRRPVSVNGADHDKGMVPVEVSASAITS